MIVKLPLSFFFDVREAFENLEAFLTGLQPAVEKIIEEQRQRAADEPYDPENPAPFESYRAEFLEEVLPRTFQYSTVMHAHAALDLLLAKLCDYTQRALSLPFGRRDMRDGATFRGRLSYLSRALGSDLPESAFDGAFRQKLEAFSAVRHSVAHASGEIAASSQPAELQRAAQVLGIGTTGQFLDIPAETIAGLLKEAEDWVCSAIDSVGTAIEKRRTGQKST